MIRDPDSPAGLLWRISWLAGYAPVPEPEPEPGPEWNVKEVTTWGGRVVARRYLMEAARRAGELAALASVPPARVGRLRASLPSDPSELDRRLRTANPYITTDSR